MTSAMQDDPANRNFFEKDVSRRELLYVRIWEATPSNQDTPTGPKVARLEGVIMSISLQIRYDSFSAPLLLLGCFSKDTTFPEATPTFELPDDGTNDVIDGSDGGSGGRTKNPPLHTSGSFSNFEAEFKTGRQPSNHLDEDSFIFCAAEIFRFLRDMALDVPGMQSPTILTDAVGGGGGKVAGGGGRGTSVKGTSEQREKNFYGAPPVTSKKAAVAKFGSSAQHLIHPGAVLCMIDLLPALVVSEDMLRPQVSESGRGTSPLLVVGERSVSPLSDAGLGSSKENFLSATTGGGGGVVSAGGKSKSPSQKSEESFYDAEEEVVGVAGKGAESDDVLIGEEGGVMRVDEMGQVGVVCMYVCIFACMCVWLCYTVEPLNNGTQDFVLCREVVLFWRLFCIELCILDLSFVRRFVLFRSVLYSEVVLYLPVCYSGACSYKRGSFPRSTLSPPLNATSRLSARWATVL